MPKKIHSFFLSFLFIIFVLSGCSNAGTTDETANESTASEESTASVDDMDFDELVEAAAGTTVTFYGWGGDEKLNQWLDEVYGPTLKEKYNLTLERVPMDIEQILSQLSNEKQAGETEGSIDIIWINGENFQTARENDFLYGPITDKMPNFDQYVDAKDLENTYDFGYPIDGHEAPFSKAQLVFMKDSFVTEETPKSAEGLLEFVQKYPGQVTYPALPVFTGSVFVRNIIYEFVDYKEFQEMPADKATVKEAIQPALDYLIELNPYLWNEGQTFPSDSTQLNNMFMDGEVVLNMSYGAYDVAIGIENGNFTKTTTSFVFENGTIGNTNFLTIAENTTNQAGAIVAINEMLSPDIQLSKYDSLREISVLDNSKLSNEQQEAFDAVDTGPGTISQDELLSHRLPEMPAELVPIIEEIWLEEVVGR